MTDLDAARERHVREKGEQDCVWCDTQWPCDAALFRDQWDMWKETARRITEYAEQHIAERDAAKSALDDAIRSRHVALNERDSARALADDLASAAAACLPWLPEGPIRDGLRAALAKREASHG